MPSLPLSVPHDGLMSTSNKIKSVSINLFKFITLSSCGRKALTERVFTFERVLKMGVQRPLRLLFFLPKEGGSRCSRLPLPSDRPNAGYETRCGFHRRPGRGYSGSNNR